MYLFIDTTVNVTLGLLDYKCEWLEYKYIESKKSSALLHAEIDDILNKNKLKIEDVKGLLYTSGPGSYTGMRVSEGIAQVFSWRKFPVYSFYHFDVPKMINLKEGYFVSKAFKGEFFVCNTLTSEKKLVPISTIDKVIKSALIYSNDPEIDLPDVTSTSVLIKNNAPIIFQKVIANKIQSSIYYYRDLEDEFKRNE
jgi:tRNA threonylcarbamoyladenosine biosynthesis protein TsaB